MPIVRRSFAPRPIPNHGISGAFFFAMPEAQRKARIRALLLTGLSAAQVSSMVHESVATVHALAGTHA